MLLQLLLVKSSLELTEEGHSLPLVDASQAKLSAPLLLNGFLSADISTMLLHSMPCSSNSLERLPRSEQFMGGKYCCFSTTFCCLCQLSPPSPSTEARKGSPLFYLLSLTEGCCIDHSLSGNCLASFVARPSLQLCLQVPSKTN